MWDPWRFKFSILGILDLGSLCSSSLCEAPNGFPILDFQFWTLGILDPYVAFLYVRVPKARSKNELPHQNGFKKRSPRRHNQVQKGDPRPKWNHKRSPATKTRSKNGLLFGSGLGVRVSFLHLVLASRGSFLNLVLASGLLFGPRFGIHASFLDLVLVAGGLFLDLVLAPGSFLGLVLGFLICDLGFGGLGPVVPI